MTAAPAAAKVRIGVSGWRYTSWRGDFYPRGLPQRRELEHIGQHFRTVEINGSFYSLQRPESYRRWRGDVPEDFSFAVKGSRYVTHMLRLRDTEQGLANFFASGVLALGAQLGPILWQLPEREKFDAQVLERFLDSLPRTTGDAQQMAKSHDSRLDGRAWTELEKDEPIRYAIEPRSQTFDDPAALRILTHHGASLVVADTAGKWPRFDALTSDFVYVRLHGAQMLYHSAYTAAELDEWADLLCAWSAGTGTGDRRPRDVYVYFDNDARGHAPHDATALQALITSRNAL
ncbi:DUF72 domain-containing protein [Microbacterium phyllosphaerae]|uniref:DUF72 domain-containing protein n=1 Tax=Microbacterium phyllosphaerae TaxID=124798 RepID=UPI003D64EF94